MPELDRRDFLKLVGVGAGAAAATACSDPVEKLVPDVAQPQSITPGISVVYASTCTECPVACGLHVTTREGRPIKLEGNPDHPINRGKLCSRGQVSIGRAYHPDRIEGPRARGASGSLESTTWEEAQAALAQKLGAAGGRAVIFGGPVGPTLSGVIDRFAAAAGARRVVYQPFAQEALRAGTKAALGVDSLPIFDVGQADLIVDFGSNFLDTGLSPTEHARQFADARDVRKHPDGGTRLISVVPRLDLTTTKGEQWIPARAGSQGDVVAAVARAVIDARGLPAGLDAATVDAFLGRTTLAEAAAAADVPQADLEALLAKLLAAKSPLVLPPGVAYTASNATATAAAVMLLDAVLGAIGRSVTIPPESAAPAPASMAELQALLAEMEAGRVSVLLVHGANPVYSLPGFAAAAAKVETLVSFASMHDETCELAALVLPDHSSFESWGDAAPRPGVRSLIQPTLRPLLDTQALGDTLLAVGRALPGDAGAALGTGSFKQILEQAWADTDWRAARARGGVFGEPESAALTLGAGLGSLTFEPAQLDGAGGHALIAFPHSFLGDGSSASLPWLQEIPDPVTKITWNSWVELSFGTAEKLGVGFGDLVSVSTGAGRIEASVFPRGGIRDDAIAIPIGQGHRVGLYATMANDGAPGEARGVNVIDVLPARADAAGSRVWLGANAELAKTGHFRRISLSQWTDNQRNRGLARKIPLAVANGQQEAHSEGHHGAHHDEPPHTFEPAFDAEPGQPYRWGMTIDADRCNGCSACVAACYIENNVAVVGETQMLQHREMSWLRIERYVGEGDLAGGADRRPIPNREKLGELDVRYTPMPCQHCGAAPCEGVCPTLATYHNVEGMNGMIYNRCAGTRYCANNCSYKVRRFNYWDYGNRNFPGMLGLMLNPDVTVRQQGVMEKCSFCVQRIEAARQPAKNEGRDIRDGEVKTACQQACPTSAITFGNLRDDASAVRQAAKSEPARAYHVLRELNTRPAVTYLAQVAREEHEGSH